MQYNKGKANKGRDVESWNLPTPLCRRLGLPHSKITCAVPIISAFLLIYKGDLPLWVCVLLGLCRELHTTCTALLFAPQMPTGAGNVPPPRAALPGDIRHTSPFVSIYYI